MKISLGGVTMFQIAEELLERIKGFITGASLKPALAEVSYSCYDDCYGRCRDDCNDTCSDRCVRSCYGTCSGSCDAQCVHDSDW